jgi:hypothetical protein
MSYMPHVPCCEHEFGHPAIASGASAAAIVSIAVVFIVGEQRSTVANVNAKAPQHTRDPLNGDREKRRPARPRPRVKHYFFIFFVRT